MSRIKVPSKRKMLSTPSLPKGLPQAELTENAYQVLTRRYIRKGEKGELIETPEEMFWRVAYHIAKVEKAWKSDVQAQRDGFLQASCLTPLLPQLPHLHRRRHTPGPAGCLLCAAHLG